MALVTIMLSCVLGAIAGTVQLAFLGAGLGQAFLTYLTISMVLSSLCLTVAVARAHFLQVPNDDRCHEDLEAWQDWHAEEFMEVEQELAKVSEAEVGPDRKPAARRSA